MICQPWHKLVITVMPPKCFVNAKKVMKLMTTLKLLKIGFLMEYIVALMAN